MFSAVEQLISRGATHYYKRRAIGSGFIRFNSGRIYCLPRCFSSMNMRDTTTLVYVLRKDKDAVYVASRVFVDEASFIASLRYLCKIAASTPGHVFNFRGPRGKEDFIIHDTSKLVVGFSTGRDMLDWVAEQVDVNEIFTPDVQKKIKKL